MNVDARGGTFNNVGRDQYNLQLIIDGSTSERTVSGILRDFGLVPQLPTSGPATLPRRDVLAQAQHRYGADLAGDIAMSLTVKILQLLINHRESADDRALVQELNTLQQTLTLVGLAIQTYEYTPLGRNLANNIIPEVEKCCVALDELFHKINSYREGLFPTSIRNLWHQVWRSGSEVDGLSLLRARLSVHQRSLGEFLVALNSISWMELGNGLRAGHVSLNDFHAYLKQGPTYLRHIQVDKVLVVDHLGRNIPVPAIFCSTWQYFDYIIKGYCTNGHGYHHVRRGDYEVIRPDDGRIISRSEFAGTVLPGMVLELSIIVRRDETFKDNKDKCPRCSHINRHAIVTNGWIECVKCAGQFQAAKIDPSRDDLRGEGRATQSDDEGDKERSGKNRARPNGEDEDHIISPASRDRRNKASSSKQKLPGDHDGTQFFRRIHLIYLNDDIIPMAKYRDLTGQIVVTEEECFAIGAFSHIYEGEWNNPETRKVVSVAIKCLKGDDTDFDVIQLLNHEIRIWCSLSHKNVMPFLGLCGGIATVPAMISPLYGGNIFWYLRNNPQVDHLEILIGIACGLCHLHSKNIIHGDFDGDKVLIDHDRNPRLSGFSWSRFIDHNSPDSNSFMRSIYTGEVSKANDVYDFSVLATEILSGREQFFQALIPASKRCEQSRYLPTVFADTMWELLIDCWHRDLEKRPDMGDVVQRLRKM